MNNQRNLQQYLTSIIAVIFITSAALANQNILPIKSPGKIDRKALVTRHNITINEIIPLSPLSIGNGRFAFTADITGLQTFPESYAKGIPLTTMAEWGWHSFPNTEHYKLDDTFVNFDTYGRDVPYNTNQKGPAGSWLRANPHQVSLAKIGLVLKKSDGSPAAVTDITDIHQELNLWTGLLTSSFKLEGKSVLVKTICHPDIDNIAFQIESELITQKQLAVQVAFPYAAGTWGNDPADWNSPDKHETTIEQQTDTDFWIWHVLEKLVYQCSAHFSSGTKMENNPKHHFILQPDIKQNHWQCSITFTHQINKKNLTLPQFDKVAQKSQAHWKKFWSTGGAIDLSGSTDPRWVELERRIVLSQYLTAIQSIGKYPPQETGLTCNSWFGKFHLEMHWWHSVHFALWDRYDMFNAGLGYYNDILPQARQTAKRQGYKGARWPKMTSPTGEDSPSGIGALLIWQQPHPIYYAELCYRQHPTKKTLEEFKDIVFETADFMASFAHWDEAGKRFLLGPPVIPAQENYKAPVTCNPTYELCYWYWGLQTAQEWRDRLGMERSAEWDNVINNLSKPTIKDGIYAAIETEPYTNLQDHPSMLGALGMLPKTPLVDVSVMTKTADFVYDKWDWPDTWGWDYPMLAMTAARTGKPDMAINAMLIDTPKNHYSQNGHNYQRDNLPCYLPGNGGLLTAVAMMAAGWDDCPKKNAPGFPDDGKWIVKWENLKKMP
jgi:hypothetical protein